MERESTDRLLRRLRDGGVSISVAQRLQIERVLDTFPDRRTPEELRPLLTPILAASAEDQARIHALFAPGAAPPGPGPRPPWIRSGPGPAPPRPRRRRGVRRLAVVALVLVPAATYLSYAHQSGRWPFAGEPASVSEEPGAPQTTPGTENEPLWPVEPPPQEQPPPPPEERGRARGWWLLVPLSPLVLFALYELYRLLFLRPAVLRGQEARSPFVVDGPRPPEPPFDPEELRRTARDAARRQRADTLRLSVPRTIAATVAEGGYPALRFDALTRPSEYLVLVERRGARDQQARLADELCRRLAGEGVLLKRYFFDADPRVCYEESGARGMSLGELHRNHPGARLLIVSDGRVLTDARTGELLPWTRALAAWADRALLTPEPVGRWGLAEAIIADELPVFPATLAGVRAATEHFASETQPDWYAWWERNQEEPQPAVPHFNSPESLRRYLGEAGYRWLCACAVYPELHWRLTLRFGGLAGLGVDARERDLLRLVRLGWLRRGAIPNLSREWLVGDLGEDAEHRVRQALLKELEGAEDRSPDSARRAEVDRTLQQLFLHRDDPGRVRRLLRTLRRLPRAPLVEDVVAVRLLHRLSPSRLRLILPARMQHLLYQNGIPALGMTPWSRGVLCAAAAAVLWAALPVFPVAQTQEGDEGDTPFTEVAPPLDSVVTTTTVDVDTTDTAPVDSAGADTAGAGSGQGNGDTAAATPIGVQNPVAQQPGPDPTQTGPAGPATAARPPAFSIARARLVSSDGTPVTYVPARSGGALERPRLLIVHGSSTGSLQSTVLYLAQSQIASVHVVIGRDGRVVQMAPFDSVAFHAGRGEWNGVRQLNRLSIGVELVNWGRLRRAGNAWVAPSGDTVPDSEVQVVVDQATGAQTGWHRYTEPQVQAVIGLYRTLRKAYPSIEQVLGHQETDPTRRVDPGPAFPMDRVRTAVLSPASG